MATEAVALLRIPPAEVEKLLGPAGSASPEGDPKWTALDDAILLYTRQPMREAEPDEIAEAIGNLFGEALDAHDDERGILLFPEAALPKAKSYAAAVDEVADMGEWAKIPEATMPDMGDMMGAFGPQMAAMQQQLLSDPAALQAAMAQMGSMLGIPPGPGGGAPDPQALLQALGGLDLGAMMGQAQRFMQENPGAAEDMMKNFGMPPGMAGPGEGDDEDPPKDG
jgi:hypothetical protein